MAYTKNMSERYILLVDDEKNILSSLTRELHSWAGEKGFTILTAMSGADGLSVLDQMGEQVEIIISDLSMPEMFGSDFLLEAKRRYPDIVSILLTGYNDAKEISKAVSAGIFSYLLKPWDRAYLIAEIDKAATYHQLVYDKKVSLERLEDELRWAGEMQKTILKPNLSTTEGVEFRLSYRPLPTVGCGGDYYDVVSMGQSKFLMLVGDVEGHGVKAAFVTGILKAVIYPEYLRSFYGKAVSPGELLGWLNERMNFEMRNSAGLQITFFAGLLDLKEGLFRYANAGHKKPFSVRDGIARELPVQGPVIGINRVVHYVEQVVGIKENDTIFIYTGGLVELRTPNGNAEDLDLASLLAKTPYSSDFHKKILEGALAMSGVAEFMDDVTILSARVGKHAP
jgi:phosphoserine phosphatase RsbU/P